MYKYNIDLCLNKVIKYTFSKKGGLRVYNFNLQKDENGFFICRKNWNHEIKEYMTPENSNINVVNGA